MRSNSIWNMLYGDHFCTWFIAPANVPKFSTHWQLFNVKTAIKLMKETSSFEIENRFKIYWLFLFIVVHWTTKGQKSLNTKKLSWRMKAIKSAICLPIVSFFFRLGSIHIWIARHKANGKNPSKSRQIEFAKFWSRH